MGTSKDRKFEKSCSMAEAAEILKAAGAALETGGTLDIDGQAVDMKDCAKLKLGLKKKGETVTVKLEVKSGAAAGEEGEEDDEEKDDVKKSPAPSYKKLKKRMGEDFKSIGKALDAGAPMSPEAVPRFLEDAAAMTGFPGKGDEFYDDFRKDCDAFRDAIQSADAGRTADAYAALKDRKKQCHGIYKK